MRRSFGDGLGAAVRAAKWLGEHPRVSALLSLALGCLVARPWGDFPLNDDWQYAVVARHFAETGQLVIDVPVAPALVGQSVLAFPFLRLFGFSHTLLRLLTLALAAVLLCALESILRAASTLPRVRALALVSLSLSPFFFYLSTTFMTEIYGLVPAMLAAALWLRDRDRTNGLSWFAALACALLCGAAYWTRQFSALVLPALALATALSLLRDHGLGRRFFGVLLKLVVSLSLLVACALAHAAWARATHNAHPEQQPGLAQILHVDRDLWKMQPGIAVLYLTLFSLPALLLFPRRVRAWQAALPALGLIALGVATHQLMQRFGFNDDGIRALRHRDFPFNGEAFINAGLGPLTLSDRFWADGLSPTRWPKQSWLAIELVLIAASVSWVHATVAFAHAFRERPRAAEVALFGASFAAASFVAAVQVEQPWMHDRYYFPCALGFAIALAALVDPFEAGRARRAAAGLAALLLAAFTVAAVHDEFRWNEARWRLVDDALSAHVDPLTIEGGYEVDGWLRRSAPLGARPTACIGLCRCPYPVWECLDDSNRIGLSVARDYAPVEQLAASAWLGQDPVLIWSQRRPPARMR